MNKLTPAEAWSHIKALCPMADHIRNVLGCEWVAMVDDLAVFGGTSRNIDWPKGVERWPMPEPEWQQAEFPRDWGKPARFRNPGGDWEIGVIRGKSPKTTLWYDDQGFNWPECQVRVEPEEAPTLEDLKTMEGRTSAVVQNDKLFDGLVKAWVPGEDGKAVQVFPEEGSPIETAPKRDGWNVMLLMGGEWLRGRWSEHCGCWLTTGDDLRSLSWDEANQPTRWKTP